MLGKRLGANKKEAKAQGMIEFALVLPVLFLVIFGLFEVGRAVFIYSTVVTAAREAARYGSASDWDNAANARIYKGQYLDCSGILEKAQNIDFMSAFSQITVQYYRGTTRIATCQGTNFVYDNSSYKIQSGDRIVVEVQGLFVPVVHIAPLTNLTFRSESRRTVLGCVDLPSAYPEWRYCQ